MTDSELRHETRRTQEYLLRKLSLEEENKKLEREEVVRQDLIKIRLGKVNSRVIKYAKDEEQMQSTFIAKQRKIVGAVLKQRGLEEFNTPISPSLVAQLDLEEVMKQLNTDEYLIE